MSTPFANDQLAVCTSLALGMATIQGIRPLTTTRFNLHQDPKGILSDDILPDGTVVKKGGLVTYVPYSMGRMTDLWGPDAEEFRPERWLKDGVFVPASPYKFTAFQVRQHTAFFLSSGPSYLM